MNLYNTGSCNGKGLVLKYFPFNCFVSFDRDISFEEILRVIPVVVLVSEGTAKIHTVNEIREIPLEI